MSCFSITDILCFVWNLPKAWWRINQIKWGFPTTIESPYWGLSEQPPVRTCSAVSHLRMKYDLVLSSLIARISSRLIRRFNAPYATPWTMIENPMLKPGTGLINPIPQIKQKFTHHDKNLTLESASPKLSRVRYSWIVLRLRRPPKCSSLMFRNRD